MLYNNDMILAPKLTMTNYELSPLMQASALIEERTGIAASTQFRAELEPILYNLAHGDIAAFVARLREERDTSPAWQMLLNALTIGETYFFRDPAHFRLLRSHILPELLQRRRQQGQKALNIWSVGCATGEEPYSVAMVLRELLPDLPDWMTRLVATDINAYALDTARKGVYRRWAFRLPSTHDSDFQGQYFNPAEAGVQLKPFIRKMVTFRHGNLLSGAPLPQLDVILCRNVLIYFKHNQVEIAENILFDALAPGGWLILGQSEATRFWRERWITHLFPGAAIYQKPFETAKASNGHLPYHQHTQPKLEITRTYEVTAVRVATYDDAVLELQKDQPDVAERLLVEVLTYQPDCAPAHMLLATILASRRALPEARAHIDTALRIDPLQPDAHYLRAMLHMDEGHDDDARKSLNAALYCQRNHPLASFLLGNLSAQAGDIGRANRLWENARRAIASLKPDSPISDISDMTAGRLTALLAQQLNGWQA